MPEHLFASLLAALCYVESGNNPQAINIADGTGTSYGQCQVKLETARWLGFKGGVLELWLNSTTNKKYAALYLKYQLNRYKKVEYAISAYNAGSVKDGRIRNKRYVSKVLRQWRGSKKVTNTQHKAG